MRSIARVSVNGSSVSRQFVWYTRLYFASLMGLWGNLYHKSGLGLGVLYNPTWVLLYAISLLYLVPVMMRRAIPLRHWSVLYFACFIGLSPLWSELPVQSAVYSLGLIANMLFALVLSLKMSRISIIMNVRWALNAMLLTGLILFFVGYPGAIYFDGLSRSNSFGTQMMQGMFTHKNYLSVYAAVAFALNYFTQSGKARAFWLTIASVNVLLAGSTTGLTTLLLVGLLIVILNITHSKNLNPFLPVILGLILIVGIIITTNLTGFLEALGRDPTLTGRTELWAWAIYFFIQKPLIGWGYGGIFADGGGGPANIFNHSGYIAPHFHNGFLQVLAETGLFGGGFMFVIVVFGLITTVRYGRKTELATSLRTETGLLVSLMALFSVMFAINILMRYNDLTFVLIMLAFLGRPVKDNAVTIQRPQSGARHEPERT